MRIVIRGLLPMLLLWLSGCAPELVDQAEQNLERAYHGHSHFADQNVECSTASLKGRWFIYCASAFSSHRHDAIYLVDEAVGGFRLAAVNQAARQAASLGLELPIGDLSHAERKRYPYAEVAALFQIK